MSCCEIPPVISEDYTPKGEYTEIAGLKAYVTGPADSKRVVLFTYDIFGFAPQTVQGADLLASQGFKVVIADFLVGKYATADMFLGTPESDAKRGTYFTAFPGKVDTQSAPIAKMAKALKTEGVKLGVIGACWGYKCVITSEGVSTFDAIAGIHPTFLAESDADAVNVPLALLPSEMEDIEVVKKIMAVADSRNPGKNVMEHFPTMPHGWMAGRADLKDEEKKAKYTEGWQIIADFFKASL